MTASDAEAAKLPEGIVSLLCRVIEPGLAQHGDYDFVMGIPSSLSTIYFGNDFAVGSLPMSQMNSWPRATLRSVPGTGQRQLSRW